MVVKIGGAALDDPTRAGDLWDAIAEVSRLREGRLILVHGGGKAVDAQFDRLGLATERRDGIRITPREHMDQVVGILAGLVNKAIVGALQRRGLRPVGLCLGDGAIARTIRATGYGFDPGCVGTIEGGDPRLLELLMGGGFLPVLSSIGLDAAGDALNINADEAAAGVARITGAGHLVLLTDVPGILGRAGALLPEVFATDIEHLIADGVIRAGMIPKARAAAAITRSGGIAPTIASWDRPRDLVRLAHGEPAGTRILPLSVPDEPCRAAPGAPADGRTR